MPRLPHYQASGRTSPRFVVTAAAASAVALGAGWVYQALTGLGYVALGILLYLLFLLVIATLVVAAGRLGHNRNRAAGALVALTIAGAGLGSAYYFDCRGTAEVARGQGATMSFGDFVDHRVAAGWTLGKRHAGDRGTLTGAWVWLAWGVEAVGLAACSLGLGVAFGPYCERCGRWMLGESLRARPGCDQIAVDSVGRATAAEQLLAPPAAAVPPGPFTLLYSAHRCPTCAADAYLTVVARHVVTTARGQSGTRRTLHLQVAVPVERLAALRAG